MALCLLSSFYHGGLWAREHLGARGMETCSPDGRAECSSSGVTELEFEEWDRTHYMSLSSVKGQHYLCDCTECVTTIEMGLSAASFWCPATAQPGLWPECSQLSVGRAPTCGSGPHCSLLQGGAEGKQLSLEQPQGCWKC